MSLSINFTPHSHYMGFAIKHDNGELIGSDDDLEPYTDDGYIWEGYIDNGNTYMVDMLHADTLEKLKQRIRQYHLDQRNGYGERIANRRLKYLRHELQNGRISYGELLELASLRPYIEVENDDTDLLQAINERK